MSPVARIRRKVPAPPAAGVMATTSAARTLPRNASSTSTSTIASRSARPRCRWRTNAAVVEHARDHPLGGVGGRSSAARWHTFDDFACVGATQTQHQALHRLAFAVASPAP